MFRIIIYAGLAAAASATGYAHAGALDALAQGGAGDAAFQGFWVQRSDETQYQGAENTTNVFRVRYYKQSWKYKRYAAFRTFADAQQFLLKKKMEGYTANLSIYEFSSAPKKQDYWLP